MAAAGSEGARPDPDPDPDPEVVPGALPDAPGDSDAPDEPDPSLSRESVRLLGGAPRIMSIELRFDPPFRGASVRVATDADDPGATPTETPAAAEDVP